MKPLNLLAALRVGLLLAAAMILPEGALAQVVTQLPQFAPPATVLDMGNGPQEIRMLDGSMGIFTSQGSGVGSTSGSSTSLTLTSTAAATPPCVGCIISGTGITSGTTVTAFNGTTGIALSAAMTVAASTPVAWGVACPSTPGTARQALVRSGADRDIPLYTQARLCASGNNGPGGSFLSFAIGAH